LKPDFPLGLNAEDSSVDILGHPITPVQNAAGRVLAMPGVALHHGIGRFQTSVDNLSFGELLVVGLLSGDDGGVGDEVEVNPWSWDQISLKLILIHIDSSTKLERGSETPHNLDQTVEICVGGALHVQVTPADVLDVDDLVVNHEGTVSVLQVGVGAEGIVIKLYHGGGHPGAG